MPHNFEFPDGPLGGPAPSRVPAERVPIADLPAYVPPPDACSACCGAKYLGMQWCITAMRKCGGRMVRFRDGHGFSCVTADDKEMPVKTIGGWCTECKGTGKARI